MLACNYTLATLPASDAYPSICWQKGTDVSIGMQIFKTLTLCNIQFDISNKELITLCKRKTGDFNYRL